MDDRSIVALFLNRDESALAECAAKYERYCLKISGNILENTDDAMECVNDAYLNVWNSIPPHQPENLAAYLGKIVRNLSFNLYKKQRAEKRGGYQMPLLLDELADVVSGSSVPEEEWEAKELSGEISAFLRKISEEKRYMFIHRYWYAESIKAISKNLHTTENKVSVTLNRVRNDLRKELQKNGYL